MMGFGGLAVGVVKIVWTQTVCMFPKMIPTLVTEVKDQVRAALPRTRAPENPSPVCPYSPVFALPPCCTSSMFVPGPVFVLHLHARHRCMHDDAALPNTHTCLPGSRCGN
jgi:hypothetical protein